MNWRPDSEWDKEETTVGLSIMRREELERLATVFTMGHLENKSLNAHVKGWEAAIYIQKQLDEVAPIKVADG